MTITHGMSRRQFLIGADVARAIAVVDPATVSDEEIAVLKAAGVVGLRINLAVQGEDPGAAAVEAAGKATARVADHGLVVQIFADMPLLEPLEETIGTAPVPIALDHFAGAKAGEGRTSPASPRWSGCSRTARLAAVSRPPRRPFPHRKAAAKVAAMSFEEITRRIAAAAERAGRPAASVALVAVSKVQPADRVRAVLDAGQRAFGENRVQEAEERWPPLRAAYPGVSLHLVGPLQSNKLARALDLFDAIHSLDRDRLARKLADAVQARGSCPTLFVQVNTGREPQKAGIDPDSVDAFLATCRTSYGLPIFGLMAIPPVDTPPGPHFVALRQMAEQNGLSGLSMGMSDDFEEAIACGATHVRVGSALFGARAAPA